MNAMSLPVKLPNSVTYAAGTILCEIKGKNEVVTLTEATNITAGTYTLTFGGQTTAAIAWDATAAQVQAALEALSTIGTGNVSVTGMSGGLTAAPATITFINDLGYQDVGALTSTQSGLTGTFNIAVATAGVAATYGTWKEYSAASTDGSQTGPCRILQYACATDSSGNITMGTASGGGSNDETVQNVPAWVSGDFACADVPNMTEALLDTFGGRMIQGTVYSNGIFRLP
jgi:hypothetical protein